MNLPPVTSEIRIAALSDWRELRAIAGECWDFALSESGAKQCLAKHKSDIRAILKFRQHPTTNFRFAWDWDATVLGWLRLRAVCYAGPHAPTARPAINPRRANYPLADEVKVVYVINAHPTGGSPNSPGWENAVRVLEERRATLRNNELIG